MADSRSIRALVPGGAGFIAGHVVDVLIGRGFEVTVIVDLSSGSREHVSEAARFMRADVASPEVVHVIQAAQPDLVIQPPHRSASHPRYTTQRAIVP